MMMAFDVQAATNHRFHHFGTQVLIMIGGWNREISFLVARPVTEVLRLAAGVPAPLLGIDEIVAGVLILIEADTVEYEEFGLGAEICCVGEPAIIQVHFGLAGDPAWITLVVLARDGIDHVAGHYQSANLAERIDEGSVGVGNEQHVALVDGGPSADARSINPEARFKRIFGELADGIGNVLLEAGQISEAQIDLVSFLLSGKLQNFLKTHVASE